MILEWEKKCKFTSNLPKAEERLFMFCFNCGTQTDENTKFCGKCGSTIQQESHQIEQGVAQQSQMMKQPSESTGNQSQMWGQQPESAGNQSQMMEQPTESTGNQSQMWEQQPQVAEQTPRGKKWLPFVVLGVVALGIVFAFGIGIALLVSGNFNANGDAQENLEMAEVVELEPVMEQESEVENPLVGRWVFEDDPNWVTTFNADGTGTHTISWGYGTTFRWSIWQNNTIRWNYTGYPMMVTPFRVSNNALYITVDDGTVYRYIRD